MTFLDGLLVGSLGSRMMKWVTQSAHGSQDYLLAMFVCSFRYVSTVIRGELSQSLSFNSISCQKLYRVVTAVEDFPDSVVPAVRTSTTQVVILFGFLHSEWSQQSDKRREGLSQLLGSVFGFQYLYVLLFG